MIKLIDTGLAYDGVSVLSGLNHTFLRNEFTCIIGKNGSGKSTLLRAVAGIAPYSGSILLDGEELRLLSRTDRAKRLSFLPQTRNIPQMDAASLIAHGRYPHLGFSKTLTGKDKERIEYAASVTGVKKLLCRSLSELSGGERQRVYIAMMVAQDAELMLLDEPAAYLDIEHQLEVMELMKDLYNSGKGIVMAVHDLPQAFSYATNILLISKGGIAVSGKPDDLCNNSVLAQALGVMVVKAEGTNEIYSYHINRR